LPVSRRLLSLGEVTQVMVITSMAEFIWIALTIVGLIEKARFACLPLGLAARNCYDQDFVISCSDRRESIRSLEEIFAKDKVA
jgi:hypothetical protein